MRKQSMFLAVIFGVLFLCSLAAAQEIAAPVDDDDVGASEMPLSEEDEAAHAEAAQAACGYYDAIGVWNRSDVTVVYWIRHPAYNTNTWVPVTLPPNTYYYHWVRGSQYGQYFQIAYDWDLCSAGSQFTYFYPTPKTVYKCSIPALSEMNWYHITRRNACVIGM